MTEDRLDFPYMEIEDTARIRDLRHRVRTTMTVAPENWMGPERIDDAFMNEPVALRRARAIAAKLSAMPIDHWQGQLIAGSMTLENPRLHLEPGFPVYLTEDEQAQVKKKGLSTRCFGHIVPDYPRLLEKGLLGIRDDALAEKRNAQHTDDITFLDSTIIALEAPVHYAQRLAEALTTAAGKQANRKTQETLLVMAANLAQVPARPAQTFWQALQSVWLLHMIFHSTANPNALGRTDQYLWPYLKQDMDREAITLNQATELVDCFFLKFNERAKTTDDQRPESRDEKQHAALYRTRHRTSSQVGTHRDHIDATNHWLQNMVICGIRIEGSDGTNPLTFLFLRSYHRNQMTNPLITLRIHRDSPEEIILKACEVLKAGGGMPAIFNDEVLVPAIEKIGIPLHEARDYTNDGCWETIIPGRTDFSFMRLSLALCLEWALNGGRPRIGEDSKDNPTQEGPDTGDARGFTSFEQVWQAFSFQLEAMVDRVIQRTIDHCNDRHMFAPVPLLSALIEGTLSSRKDLTAGGARYRTFALLAESTPLVIDSLTAINTVIFQDHHADMSQLCDALDQNFQGHAGLRARLLAAPKYGNDDPQADGIGRRIIDTFSRLVEKHGKAHASQVKFTSGVGTFSWYIGIGQGLGPSPDGRLSGEPVSSNFSPGLGQDMAGIPGAILSYGRMNHMNLPAGAPLDLRLPLALVKTEEGTRRMAALVRGFSKTGGSMLTLTVADAAELRAAQQEPDKFESLRVRMGGWSAYFTMLSREQQDHHIHRQEGRS